MEEVAKGAHESKNGRISRPFTDVASMHLGPGCNRGTVNFPGVGDKLVWLPRDRDPDPQQWRRSCWRELLASLANAGGGLHSEPGSAQRLHMAVESFAKVLVGLAQGNCSMQQGNYADPRVCHATLWHQSNWGGILNLCPSLGEGQGKGEQDCACAP